MDVHGLFATAKFGKTLGGYLKLFETLDIKIDRLAAAELEAGISALKQAINSEQEIESLLREARSRFNKAISLEKDEKLAMAYLGLGLCHYYLGDKKNCLVSFELLKNLDFSYIDDKDMALALAGFAVSVISFSIFAYQEHRCKQRGVVYKK